MRDDAPADLFGAEPAPRRAAAAVVAHSSCPPSTQPLADRLRPKTLDDVVGQAHLLGPEGALRMMLARRTLPSLILWGGPGCGKTTIARLLAGAAGLRFEQISAVFSGVADLKKVFDNAQRFQAETGRGTLLFVDEIHRFNRAQQDGFLPYVERGTVVLVGATTENPSFALNGALLSRCQVLVLNRLDDSALEALIVRAEGELGRALPLDEAARATLRAMADGDGRYLLNLVEQVAALDETKLLAPADLAALLARRAVLYDKDREEHYNLISALHKSLRGSDPDAGLYWFARMLEGGEDPRYIARRLTRFAAEDVGMADPSVLPLAIAAWETYERLGSPEGELALAELVVALATAPKSNAVYKAYKAARRLAKETGSLGPPHHIRNAPTRLMKDLGYGRGYEYDHDTEEAFSGQDYFPDEMERVTLYAPTPRGREAEIRKVLDRQAAMRASRRP
ncbi:replication-associated recombination protein A [Acidomonas methanolica]|uniref:Replication-associated recombination protein A n=1 Tax=Acidomonas methanolica NBRC 104435 TaxID=1231351 RepID=A0A023D552_ACIMT|nr:replication-associated recombination protein A [Acidomonas methanolica]MBU2654875.1 replication-associated recombination protein A [Acidomonas methanolica]TCS24778.1 putative ATPase [Acidomonas methanolica]GAJ29169.1 recombination factor protein RarA/AAA ATPase [Acidomonas methanolica NBRC 104435]GEK99855.1 ATPase AAA [Acidomonas methanolica NBRC 104435]